MMTVTRILHAILPHSVPRTLKVLLACVLLALLLHRVAWRAIAMEFQHIAPRYIILYVLLIAAAHALSAWRWRTIAAISAAPIPFRYALRHYIIGVFINNFLPSVVGGDAYRVVRANRDIHGHLPLATFIVLADRAIGLFAHLVLMIIAALLLALTAAPLLASPIVTLLWSGSAILIGVGIGVFLARTSVMRLVARLMPRRADVVRYARHFNARLFTITTLQGLLFVLVGVVAANYSLFLALGARPDGVAFLFLAPAAAIVAMAPISIGNVGVKEWAYVVLMGLIHVPASTAIAAVLLGRVLQMIVSLIGVPLYIMDRT